MVHDTDSEDVESGLVRLMARFQIEQADDDIAMRILSRLATAASSLPGCRSCTLFHTAEDSSPLILVEEWDSEKLLQRHMASEGFHSVLVHFGSGLRPAHDDRPSDGITLRFSRAKSDLGLESYVETLSGTDYQSRNIFSG
jgi:quinol monooxygenase YgiN